MTTQSHTELAARLREAHDLSLDGNHFDARVAVLEVVAALESPERVQGEMVLVPRKLPRHARMYLLSGEKSWSTVLDLIATPSPQAEKQPLSDVQMDSVVEDAHKSLRRYKSGIRGQQITQYDGIEAHVVRATELAHGIVTKEST